MPLALICCFEVAARLAAASISDGVLICENIAQFESPRRRRGRNPFLHSGRSGGKENSMKNGIIGVGKVGSGLGKLWVRAGHQVFFRSRHPNRLKVLVEQAGSGAYAGNVADAALFGDVLLFSPNFWGVDGALEATRPLSGTKVR
jgi:hypothetical protein